MLPYVFAFIVFMHGIIHLMGFAKAFGYGNITQLSKDISKPVGIGWLITALLFVLVTILFLMKKESWPLLAIVAGIFSEVLIITVWKDAKWGTFANATVVLVAIAGWASDHFESQFRNDVKTNLQATNTLKMELLTEPDLQHLPQPVQRYIRYSGAVNQAKVKNVRILLEGEMRSRTQDWFKFETVQYNFFKEPARLFFMKAKMFGITVPGYHKYQNAIAGMRVNLFGLFPVMQAKGPEMNKAETVTIFNDMCLMVPAALIDKRIDWEPIDSSSAKATFTNKGIKIAATLYFNERGQLVNFISDDRYDIGDMRQYRFSTPVEGYQLINGRNVISQGDAVWHYPDGEFVYGKFYLRNIEINVANLKY